MASPRPGSTFKATTGVETPCADQAESQAGQRDWRIKGNTPIPTLMSKKLSGPGGLARACRGWGFGGGGG